jgi:predicted DNA-binding transcriptional regulator AlpA
MNPAPILMRRGEVAHFLRVDRHTLLRMVKRDPTFPKFFALSAGVDVLDRADLLEWIEQRRLSSRVAQIAP